MLFFAFLWMAGVLNVSLLIDLVEKINLLSVPLESPLAVTFSSDQISKSRTRTARTFLCVLLLHFRVSRSGP